MNLEVTKPKLLVAVDTYYPKKDGVLIFLEKVLPKLTDTFDITILAPKFTKKVKKIKNCKIVRLETYKNIKLVGYKSVKVSFKNSRTIKKYVKKTDIVWSQDLAYIGALSIYYGKKFKKPTINFVHQITTEHAVDILKTNQRVKNILAKVIKKLTDWLYNHCDLLMVPYPELAFMLNQKDIASKKEVITLGVDAEKFSPPNNKDKAKTKIGISPDLKVIGYCGRLSKEKSLETLKEAYEKVKATYKNCCLLIVGTGPEKKELKSIKDTIIVGSVKNPASYYQAMDLFIMPSLTETTSLATLEAMATGLTVVSTKVGYIKTYIKDRINGFFFPKENAYVLSKKIEILLKNDEMRKEVGKRARQTTIKDFSWNKTINNIRKSIEKLT